MKAIRILSSLVILVLISTYCFSMPYSRYENIFSFPPQVIWTDLGGTTQIICTSTNFELWAQTDAEVNSLNPGEYWTYEWQYLDHTYWPPRGFPIDVYYSTGVTTRDFSDIHNSAYNNKNFRCIVKKFSASNVELSSTGNGLNQWVKFHIDVTSNSISSQPQDINGICEGELVTLDFGVDEPIIECQWKRRLIGNTSWQVFSPDLDLPYYTFNATSTHDAYEYVCEVKNGCGATYTNVIQLNLLYPPEVANHPVNRSICEGTGATMSITMANTSYTYAYQWEMKAPGGNWTNVSGTNFSGTTNNELVISNITNAYNDYQFRCYATSNCSPGAYSNPALLRVKAKPVITSSLANPIFCEGADYSYNTEATGYPPLEYKWELSFTVVSEWSANKLFELKNIKNDMSGGYYCFVRNECGSTSTKLINLNVTKLPHIETISSDISICEGDDTPIGISVSLSGEVSSLKYEESKDQGLNWTELTTVAPNITQYSLSLPTASMNGHQYRVIAYGSCEPSDTSDIVNLEVKTIPLITGPPVNKTACEGSEIIFDVEVSGSPTLEYRWKKGGTTLGIWSTTSSLLLENITTDDYDSYYVQVRNGCTGLNTIESDEVSLTVHPEPIVNLGADKHLCPGSSVELSPGSGYSSYLWSNEETTSKISVSEGGIYEVTVSDQYSCSNSDKILVITDPLIPELNLGPDLEVCEGTDVVLDASNEYDSYSWSDGSSNQSITITESGTYSITVKRNMSVCELSDEVLVTILSPYENEEICMISIDKETGKNMIIWEKTPDVRTEFYQIWRQTNVQGEYVMKYESAFGDESIFIDLESNPEVKAELYKLVLLDTCRNASEASLWHKPMFLTSSLGANEDEVNLAWTPYLINNIEVNFPSYIIFRGEGTGSLAPIDTLAAGAGTNLYTDRNPPANVNLYYRIAGVKEQACDPNGILSKKAESGPFIHSLSNLEDNRIKTGTVNEKSLEVSIYPNPMEQWSTIDIPDKQSFPVVLRIMDSNGRILRETEYYDNHIIIEREALKAGFYFIEIVSDAKYIGKLMVK